MTKNGSKCAELGWECIPLAVETYGGWGEKAQEMFNRTSRRLAVGSASSEGHVWKAKPNLGEGEHTCTMYIRVHCIFSFVAMTAHVPV